MAEFRDEILAECERLGENCLYTSTTMFIWLRAMRTHRRLFLLGQVVFSLAAVSFAVNGDALWAGVFGATAGLSPMVWDALKMEAHVGVVAHHAAQFVELRDEFRQVQLIHAAKGDDALEVAFVEAKTALRLAREASVTPPERFFQAARRKIASGDYEHSPLKPSSSRTATPSETAS